MSNQSHTYNIICETKKLNITTQGTMNNTMNNTYIITADSTQKSSTHIHFESGKKRKREFIEMTATATATASAPLIKRARYD